MSKALGPLVTPRSRRRTIAVLAIALALFTGLLIARLLNSDESNGLLGLQVIPIALVALELGMVAGLCLRGGRAEQRRDLVGDQGRPHQRA
jgi:hypothetical protein